VKYLSFLGVLLLSAAGCVNDIKQVEALHTRSVGVEVAKDIKTYYYGVNGHIKGVLTAPWLYRYMKDTPYMVLDHGLKVEFYNDSMQLQSVLTAKRGEYYENSNNITVSDSVVVTTQTGKRLSTSVLHWDPNRQQFYTDSPATLVTPTQNIVALRGLEAPPDISWYTFKQASGELKMDSGYLSPAPDSLSGDSAAHPGAAPASRFSGDTVKAGPRQAPHAAPAPVSSGPLQGTQKRMNHTAAGAATAPSTGHKRP
jgi:LPS export ABC transporter protein LptC